MEVLFILVPLSVVLVMAILGVFAWALRNGQLDDLEREGLRILHDERQVPGVQADAGADAACVDGDQVARQGPDEQSSTN